MSLSDHVTREEFDSLLEYVRELGVKPPMMNSQELTELDEVRSALESYRSSIEGIVSDWKAMLIRPMPIDAYAITLALALAQVANEIHFQDKASGCTGCEKKLMPSTVDIVRKTYTATSGQSEAIRGFIQWASQHLSVAFENDDPEAKVIVSNLAAAEMIDVIDSAWSQKLVQTPSQISDTLES